MTSDDVARRPRAVVLVGNPAAPYSRALRIARTLHRAGYDVEIAAVAAAGLAESEEGDGWTLRRYRASGLWARLGSSGRALTGVTAMGRRPAGSVNGTSMPASDAAAGRVTSADDSGSDSPPVGGRRAPGGTSSRPPRPSARPLRAVRRILGLAIALRRWIFWPHTVRGWWATLDRELAPADLYHACGSLTIAAALRAAARPAARKAGRRPLVIYDAVDDVFASNNVLDMPAPIRAIHARREARWASRADAVVTVNDALADRLARRFGRRPSVIPNYPEIVPIADVEPGAGPLRRELGAGSHVPIVLFQGRLGPRLGLDEAAEAVLLVPEAVLVLIGFGRGFARERERDDEARFAGRHRTLAARHPDELLAWTRDADVALIPLPPVSENQRLSTPNKFWESVAVGTPVVVPASLRVMAELVRDADLGVVAKSAGPADLAAAIRAALARQAADPGWRGRIAAIAAARFSWPAAAQAYLALVDDLRDRESGTGR